MDSEVVEPQRDEQGRLLILSAYCCRRWPVLALTPMGKCGYCHETPVVR